MAAAMAKRRKPVMCGVIELTEAQWARLYQRLAQDYKDEPSVILIRAKMRAVLGFTVRRHRVRDPRHQGMQPGWYHEWMFLDFFDAGLEIWFRLKYAEYIDE
jgi:hypothetical protein